MKRNNLIDFLRWFAAFIVCIFHFNEHVKPVDNWYRNICQYGWIGVPIFFVISGFCIAQSASSSKKIIEFGIKRVFRIFPTYWFSLVVVALCVFWQISITPIPTTPKEIAGTILLLTDPFTTIHTVNRVYWSLTVEIFFYIAIAGSLFLGDKIGKAFLLAISVLSIFELGPARNNVLFFLDHWAAFGLGLSIFYFDKFNRKSYIYSLALASINLISLFHFNPIGAYSITVLITTVLISCSRWVADIPNNFLSKLGDYSYSVYLLHVPLGIYLFEQRRTTDIQTQVVSNLLFDLVLYLFISIVAYLTYQTIEAPSIRFGKRLGKKSMETFFFTK